MPDNYFAPLICRVQLIVENTCQWIIENRCRFVKTYTVLAPIRLGFIGIPFKVIGHQLSFAVYQPLQGKVIFSKGPFWIYKSTDAQKDIVSQQILKGAEETWCGPIEEPDRIFA